MKSWQRWSESGSCWILGQVADAPRKTWIIGAPGLSCFAFLLIVFRSPVFPLLHEYFFFHSSLLLALSCCRRLVGFITVLCVASISSIFSQDMNDTTGKWQCPLRELSSSTSLCRITWRSRSSSQFIVRFIMPESSFLVVMIGLRTLPANGRLLEK